MASTMAREYCCCRSLIYGSRVLSSHRRTNAVWDGATQYGTGQQLEQRGVAAETMVDAWRFIHLSTDKGTLVCSFGIIHLGANTA